MTTEAKANIKATFEANPKLNTLFADEAGHCFTNGGDGLSAVERKDFEDGEPATEPKEPGDMTVKQLQAALTELNVEFAPKATKAELVELLAASKK